MSNRFIEYSKEYNKRQSEINEWVEMERQNKFKHLSFSEISSISNEVLKCERGMNK